MFPRILLLTPAEAVKAERRRARRFGLLMAAVVLAGLASWAALAALSWLLLRVLTR